MIRAVIFDMYETLITHYECPLYFSNEMAYDAGVTREQFIKYWYPLEYDRSIGKITLEEAIEIVLKGLNRYSDELHAKIVSKRKEIKKECFNHMHEEIIPMLQALKEKGYRIGLISNCFSEETECIRESALYPFFDAPFLSYEQGVAKPEEEIFMRCVNALGVSCEECVYVGDGGSHELEVAEKLKMHPLQAVWYLKEGSSQPKQRMEGYVHIENPIGLLDYLYKNV